jgi:hypothetical protein
MKALVFKRYGKAVQPEYPSRSWTALRFPVFLQIWAAFVRRIECVP